MKRLPATLDCLSRLKISTITAFKSASKIFFGVEVEVVGRFSIVAHCPWYVNGKTLSPIISKTCDFFQILRINSPGVGLNSQL